MVYLYSLSFYFVVSKRIQICSSPGRFYRVVLFHGDLVAGDYDVSLVHSSCRESMAVASVCFSFHRIRTAVTAFHILQSVNPMPLTDDMILLFHVLSQVPTDEPARSRCDGKTARMEEAVTGRYIYYSP